MTSLLLLLVVAAVVIDSSISSSSLSTYNESGHLNPTRLSYVLAFFERARAPYLLASFDIARAATAGDEASYDLEQRKLSAIYQFARAMPLLFVPANRDKKV